MTDHSSELSAGAKAIQRAKEVFSTEIESMIAVQQSVGDSFAQAVDLILKATARGNKLVVTGMGKSMHVGQKIAATLTSTGTPAVTLHPAEAMHGDLGIVQKGDILIAISYSGESDELNILLPLTHRNDNTIIGLTGKLESSLGRMSDLVIQVEVPREACPFNMAPTSSTTVTMAMGDALALALLEARGFKKEDYAKLHPGGAIGRALLVRIKDVMRSGDRLAKVIPTDTLKTGLFAMTRAKSGAVAVVDEHGKVVGIFTDGDLRRKIQDSIDFDQSTMGDVMTKDPILLQQDSLAVEALSVFEHHQIDDIPVVDEENCLVGFIDIQDLPKFKII